MRSQFNDIINLANSNTYVLFNEDITSKIAKKLLQWPKMLWLKMITQENNRQFWIMREVLMS